MSPTEYPELQAAACLAEHLPTTHPLAVVLFEALTGALFSRFLFSARDYNKLPSPFPDMIESRLIDLRSPSPRLEISQHRAAWINTGRSNKAGRLRGHRGAAHTVTPAITTSRPSLIHPLLTYLSWLHGLLDLLIITVIKEAMNSGFIITAPM